MCDVDDLCRKCGCCVCSRNMSAEAHNKCYECKKVYCALCARTRELDDKVRKVCKYCANVKNAWIVVAAPPRFGEVPTFEGPFERHAHAVAYSVCTEFCYGVGYSPFTCPHHGKSAVYRLEGVDKDDV